MMFLDKVSNIQYEKEMIDGLQIIKVKILPMSKIV